MKDSHFHLVFVASPEHVQGLLYVLGGNDGFTALRLEPN